MGSEVEKCKAMTTEETKTFVNLVTQSSIIHLKSTNAFNNKLKEEEWEKITEKFNSTENTYQRTTQQLRLKWENIKKSARKRVSIITKRNICKDESNVPQNVHLHEILDQVALFIGCTAQNDADTKSDVSLGDDKENAVDEDISQEPVLGDNNDTSIENSSTSASDSSMEYKQYPLQTDQINLISPINRKRLMKRPMYNGKQSEWQASQIARNKALADYYKIKTKIIEKETEQIRLKLELEMLKKQKL